MIEAHKIPTLILLGFVLLLSNSCRIEDKICEAGNPELFGTFPYIPGQHLLFKDSLEREIQVTFNPTYNNSTSYTIEGKHAFNSSKMESCIRSSGLDAIVKCIPDTLLSDNKQFSFTFEMNEDNSNSGSNYSYSLTAFQSVFIFAYITNKEFKPHNPVPIASFTTPYKTYTGILQNTGTTYQNSKCFYDKKGKLIAFTLKGDSSIYFYLVE